MPSTTSNGEVDCTPIGESTPEGGLLPADPYIANQYHFGMLLGVDDFETDQAYHRGKMRLHNAWLHREGVAWGFNVTFNGRKEIQVDPGLAVDAAGREIHLDASACLNVGRWYQAHAKDAEFTFEDADGGKKFSVDVVARFKACLTRQVPAIAEPCAGSQTDTAYSRAAETIEILLRPVGTVKPVPYHRLRVLFRLEDATAADADVVARRTTIEAMPFHAQPKAYLHALRDLAPLDGIDLHPSTGADGERSSMYPEDESTEVRLARIEGIVVSKMDAGWSIAEPLPEPDVRIRPSLIATTTIQELLCGPLFEVVAGGGAPPPGGGETPGGETPGGETPGGETPGGETPGGETPGGETPGQVDAGGPRVDPETLAYAKKRITFKTTSALHPASVDPDAFSVTSFSEEDGWSHIEIRRVTLSDADLGVTIDMKEEAAGKLVRLIAYGTGPNPLLGANLVPLAGVKGGPVSGENDGIDFVHMRRS
jgi:hypothetical protein